MADKKELALSLKIDTRQGETKLLPFAQKTTAIFEKLAKVAGGVKLGILGGGSSGDFTRAAKQWGDLGTVFSKLTTAVQANGRALDEERKRLAELRREADATARALEGAESRLNATRKFGIGFADAELHHGSAQDRHRAAREAADTQEQLVTNLSKGGGGMGLTGTAIAGAVGALAYTILKDLPNTLDAGNFRNVSNRARIGSSTGALALRPGQRDFTDLVAMSQIGGDSARASELAAVSDPNSFRRQIQKGFHMFGGLIPGSGVSIGDTFSMFGTNSREGQLFQKALSDEAAVKYIQQQSLSDPTSRLAAQQYAGQSQDHLGFMRSMGMGQSDSIRFLSGVRGQTGGKFGLASMMSMAEGIAGGGGGRASASLTSDALQVVISGMDQGVVSQMAGAFAAGGAGGAMLHHLRGVAGTSMDMFAAQRAGSFVAGNYLNGNNLNSGEGLMSFMTSGFTGGAADSFYERKREEALGGFQGIMGADPYQQTIGYVNALRIGRRGRLSLAGANKLATLDTNSILQAFRNKAPDGGLAARGINNSMILDEFNGNVDALAVRNLALGGNDPESVLARRLKGGSMSSLLLSLKGGEMDAGSALLSDAMPQVFKSDAVAKQFILGLQGAARGDDPGSPGGDVGGTSTALGLDQRAFKQEWELFTKAQGDLRDALKISGTNVNDFAEQAVRATSLMTKAADTLEVFLGHGPYAYGSSAPDRSQAGPAGDGGN